MSDSDPTRAWLGAPLLQCVALRKCFKGASDTCLPHPPDAIDLPYAEQYGRRA